MKQETSLRNPFTIHAKKRKAGVMRLKKNSRKSGKNKLRELLKENE